MLLIQVSLLAAKQDSQIAEKDNDELADDAFFSVVLDTAVVVEDITIYSSGCRGGGTTGKYSFGVCMFVAVVVVAVVGDETTATACAHSSFCSTGCCCCGGAWNDGASPPGMVVVSCCMVA